MNPPQRPLVFITGASSGIGQALAWRFHQAGWRLALVARRQAEMQAWAEQQGLPSDAYALYAADVSVTDEIVAAGQACLQRQGLPDVVVANAGISVGVDTAEREDLAVLARIFATNNIGLAATFGAGALFACAALAGWVAWAWWPRRGAPRSRTPAPMQALA